MGVFTRKALGRDLVAVLWDKVLIHIHIRESCKSEKLKRYITSPYLNLTKAFKEASAFSGILAATTSDSRGSRSKIGLLSRTCDERKLCYRY
ncbi:hypothetical protein GE21DRAFT_1092242 [Neurospora crassa]|nr:hypothetical protein GE21DRAFT_1092242 [Neurospora crassa]